VKKAFFRLLFLIAFAAAAFIGFRIRNKNEPLQYFDADTQCIVAMDGIRNKDFSEVWPFLETLFREEETPTPEEIQKNRKYLSKLYLLADTSGSGKKRKTVAIADPGLYYYLALFRAKTWLDDDHGVYRLKEEVLDEQGEKYPLLRKLRLDFGNGLIFVAQSAEDLQYFKGKAAQYREKRKGEKNKAPAVVAEDQKRKEVREILDDNRKKLLTALWFFPENGLGLTALSFSNYAKNEVFYQDAVLYFREEVDAPVFEGSDKRKLARVKGDAWAYLSLRDYSDLNRILLLYDFFTSLGESPEKARDVLSGPYRVSNSTKEALFFLQLLSGITLEDELKNIDREILLSVDEKTLAIAVKKTDRVKKIVRKIDISKESVAIDEDKKTVRIMLPFLKDLAAVNPTLQDRIPELAKNQFLAANIPMGTVTPLLPEDWSWLSAFRNIEITGQGREIRIHTSCNLEDYNRAVENIREKNKGN